MLVREEARANATSLPNIEVDATSRLLVDVEGALSRKVALVSPMPRPVLLLDLLLARVDEALGKRRGLAHGIVDAIVPVLLLLVQRRVHLQRFLHGHFLY